MINLFFDGATEPRNPGGAMGMGVLIKGDVHYSNSHYEPPNPGNTNNIAEYRALLHGLKWLIQENLQDKDIIVFGDSQLVIYQMTGRYGANGGAYIPYYKEALELKKKFSKIRFEWVRRENNEDADELSKQTLIDNGIKITVRPR